MLANPSYNQPVSDKFWMRIKNKLFLQIGPLNSWDVELVSLQEMKRGVRIPYVDFILYIKVQIWIAIDSN